MAKIIQFTGMYIAGDKYEDVNLNADCITTIRKTENKQGEAVTAVNIEPRNTIYTKLSVAEVTKLINN